MALTATKVTSSPVVTDKATVSNSNRVFSSLSKSKKREKLQLSRCRVEVGELHGCLLTAKVKVTSHEQWNSYGKPLCLTRPSKSSVLCFSGGSRHTEATDCARPCDKSVDLKCARTGDDEDEHPTVPRTCMSNPVLAEACRFVYNDAKFVNERARNDFFLLSRGIMRLDAHARQGVAILGSEFLKLDARAREDTEAIDRNVKKKAERLQRIAATLREKAQSRLKTAADEHWSDGALEADLRLADFRAKQRAMEDALMSLEFVKNIHHMMVRKMYNFPLSKENGFPSVDDDMMGHIKLEKNGKSLEFLSGELSTNRISAVQEIYWSMASALSEADGIDYTDPEELELLIRTLMDLDAMDGKSSVSLLAECSSSPDENTRQALANALAAAPSMWTLGNAGMGALQRLAEDSNPAIASAASKAIKELKKQWEIEEGDNWRFTLNQKVTPDPEADDDTDIEKCS